MLSVCIPIYHFRMRPLVEELHRQLTDSGVDFEILLMDDASAVEYRRENEAVELPYLRYIQLEENLGRSRIRNRLAEEARYPYLLFMDCDSAVPSDDYVKNYLPYCVPNAVVYGGCTYTDDQRTDTYLLRWKYGMSRERVSAAIRNQNPNHRFTTNNFLIDKALFRQVRFDESLIGYGHEDTFFAIELGLKGITITHIDNPLIHVGLESAEAFLKKTENGVANLLQVDRILSEKYPGQSEHHSKLVDTYRRLERWHLKLLAARFFVLFRGMMKRNLLGKHPSLFVFDLYKLGLICSLDD